MEGSESISVITTANPVGASIRNLLRSKKGNSKQENVKQVEEGRKRSKIDNDGTSSSEDKDNERSKRMKIGNDEITKTETSEIKNENKKFDKNEEMGDVGAPDVVIISDKTQDDNVIIINDEAQAGENLTKKEAER
eukprot:Pgem_evm2s12561